MGVIVARNERDKYSGWPPPKRIETAPEQPAIVQDAPKRRGRPPKVRTDADSA